MRFPERQLEQTAIAAVLAATFPNGHGDNASVTITNDPVVGQIDVNGQDATPSDNSGQDWLLCGGSLAARICTGTLGAPGADQSPTFSTAVTWTAAP